ncbi:5,6-dimethylbenzimidazole synthase [Acidovorax sp. GBBC 3334]|uniref:5,6-dimethylbenzimidazole synthase n=1 Tax=Acidovorax sp. GBBC 3334 TaxID=2940496 RepID=UPI0023046983|nr:5,6-dimethylbenzimidazole synthase [Acidovorax sp. GBBC 3334]MDA8454210.1 5,6-dimethylbenzimidazole synthase [Acidovorax sp. GBBC 3334]
MPEEESAGQGTGRPYSDAERDAVYRAIHERRDMRHFAGGTVEPAVLERLLRAAHHGPSVGFMQPWRFIRIADPVLRRRLHACVEAERLRTAGVLGGEAPPHGRPALQGAGRGEEFLRLKLEGLLDAAELIAVALADGREAHVFGRRTMPHMDIASVGCAIENLWLAARAEGLGLGWVSIFEPAEVAALLGLPPGAEPVALLCLGPVHDFYPAPMLERERWARRAPLASVVFEGAWGRPATWLAGEGPQGAVPGQGDG